MKFAGFDVETAGEEQEYALQPFRALTGKAWLTAASFGAGDASQGILNPTADQLRTALTRLSEGGYHITGWNGAFDAAWMIALGLEDLVFASRWMDGMLLWRHAVVEPEGDEIPKNKRKSYSLEAALKEFFPEAAHIKEFKDFQATDEESLRRLLERNKGDALFAAKLARVFWEMLTERQQRAAMIEAKCIPMVAWTYVNGINSSADLALDLSKKLQKVAEEKECELMASSPEAEGVNLGSPKQLQKLLYEDWGLPVLGTSKKTGDPSTDKFVLFDLALMDPRARLLKEIREAKNNRTKYAEATLKSLEYNGDGKVRPRARIFGTYTSRMTYSSQDEVTVSSLAKGAKLPSLWLYHGESGSFLVMAEQDYYNQPGVDGDLALCEPLGTAKTGSVAELKKLLKASGWEKPCIDAETRHAEKQEIPCEVKPVQKKVKVPTGVALHQWKRGKDYRRLIQAPPGYTLLELDAAGQEFRWMAVTSGDETMLSLCSPGEDAHSYMGAQVAEVDYRNLIERVHAEDEAAANERKCGKFCIAEGDLVLTDHGLVPIEHVSLDYRVWDGVEWVSHEGLIYQGIKEVMTYEGLTATPDHEVFTQCGRRMRLDQAAAEGYHLARTGDGRQPVRLPDDYIVRGEEGGQQARDPGALPVQVRHGVVGVCEQSDQKFVDAVQRVCEQAVAREGWTFDRHGQESCPYPEKGKLNASKMREFFGRILQELRRSWDSLSIWVGGRSRRIYLKRATSPDLPQGGHRPDGQQWSLCPWELETGYTEGESSELSAVFKRVATYDLANAGPRHRFTVSNYLISNCNLSYQYRVSAPTATKKARVDYEMNVDEPFIRKTQAIYKASYPGVPQYWRDQIIKCKSLQYAETFAGRRVQLKDNWAGKTAWAMESTAINYPIQGTGGDQKYLALAIAKNYLPQYNGYFYYELHDGLFFIFPDAKAEGAAHFFKNLLSNLPYKAAWGIDLPIAFPFDAKMGKSWGDLKEV